VYTSVVADLLGPDTGKRRASEEKECRAAACARANVTALSRLNVIKI
jgi:hypothetical protein